MPTPRYIDAERFKIWLSEQVKKGLVSFSSAEDAASLLRYAPTVDASPVIHAHWIPKKEMIRSPEAKNYNCSACGKESFAYPSCPYCRAIMDEESKQ